MSLRAVQKGEKAPSAKSVAQAAKSGGQRELLVAMRDRIATSVSNPDCPPRDLASLTKRLQDIARDIAALDALDADHQRRMSTDDGSGNGFDASAI
ncbi:MAG: hypothetical protein K0U84_01695 [Actinomycetia bacterium]|nr:hypothetical protein [Actinomycetes bacterium]